jgi:hypothetical protein
MKHEEHGLPSPETGVHIDAEKQVALGSEQEAKGAFEVQKEKMLDVNNWQHMAGEAGASFQLIDADGKPVDRKAKQGDYFKIDIPGPGSSAGDGYDWAHVEEVSEIREENAESLAIRVRPSRNPQGQSNDIAHFYAPESTSTFKIRRQGKTISASIHDRNVHANTDTSNVLDKARNAAVAAGAMTAFSKVQWQKLVEGILK